ncbi:Hypothetical predicted protein [Paramuricea clavata]|uniref:Uncharacterized protein n=1 Tax=Paramuricea clavata TaxID=317549 RepID=A0A7D9DYP3_PARCT|nr:Hypothetical predicted protein [Paramuricea clavata]
MTSAEVNIDRYKLIRLDCLHKRGGRICAYIRKDFKTVILKDLSYISECNFHQLWISVQCKKTKSVVICVTYHPDDSPLRSFDNVLKPSYIQAPTLNKPIVILRDLNCDVLKQNCPESKALINFAFKDARKAVKSMLKDSERNNYLDEVQRHKNNPGSVWKIINQAIPSKSKEKHTYTKDPKTVANEFNQFFLSVGKNAADASIRLAEGNNITVEETPLETVYMPSQDLFSFRTVTSEEVCHVIASLPLNKSPGTRQDKLSNPQRLSPCYTRPLTHIINCSITFHTFPIAWKEAEVVPIVKDGDHEVASNNRPISLLAIASKVCEKIVLEQFSSYLMSKNPALSSSKRK